MAVFGIYFAITLAVVVMPLPPTIFLPVNAILILLAFVMSRSSQLLSDTVNETVSFSKPPGEPTKPHGFPIEVRRADVTAVGS